MRAARVVVFRCIVPCPLTALQFSPVGEKRSKRRYKSTEILCSSPDWAMIIGPTGARSDKSGENSDIFLHKPWRFFPFFVIDPRLHRGPPGQAWMTASTS
jgi:hypothetical protein